MAAAALILFCAAFEAPDADPKPRFEIAYPDDYRNWMHIKSGVLKNSGTRYDGVHHIYANAKALAGYRSGSFPDGSVIVFDMWRAEETAAPAIGKAAAIIDPSERKFIDVMVRNSARYRQTGGWGFEEFRGNSRTDRLIKDQERECAACHRQGAGPDGVFSKLLD